MDSNSELILRALRYFNDNRSEIKTKEGFSLYMNDPRSENLFNADLQHQPNPWIEPKGDNKEVFQITKAGEVEINRLQAFKNAEKTPLAIISAASIIGIVEILVLSVQTYTTNIQNEIMIDQNYLMKEQNELLLYQNIIEERKLENSEIIE